jgi:restriction system protein
MEELPRYVELIEPLLKVLTEAGKPLSNSQIEAAIIKDLQIPASLSSHIHSGNRTELQYRLAWARTKAKSSGKIVSTKRETWSIKNN